MKLTKFIFTLLMGIIQATVFAQQAIPTKLSTQDTILIDGNLNEPYWNKGIISDKLYSKASPNKSPNQTSVYFLYDDDYTYISPDLRNTALSKVKILEEPNSRWHYNNYNPILLGIVLERVTNGSVSDFLEKHLWSVVGSQDASWSLDEKGFEKMESGFNATPLDYVRLGQLMLNKGELNNKRIVSDDWVYRSTQAESKPDGFYDFLVNNNVYYQYFWWGKKRKDSPHDFFAMGNKGQYLYIIPSKKIIILRLGLEYGLFTPAFLSWPQLFYEFSEVIESINR